MKKIYLLNGYSGVDYEEGYWWTVCAFRNLEDAQVKQKELCIAVDGILLSLDRWKRAEKMKEFDPKLSGWGDDKPTYSIEEIELI